LKAAVWIAEVNNRVLKCLGRAHDSKLRRIALCVKYIITLIWTALTFSRPGKCRDSWQPLPPVTGTIWTAYF
jgi:hypothetical protein